MARAGATRERDPAFLAMAAVAAAGGVLAIAFAIGLPIWASLHGRPYTPVFSLFAAWGVAALAGAYACFATYRLTDVPPRRPPGGGERVDPRGLTIELPVTALHAGDARRKAA